MEGTMIETVADLVAALLLLPQDMPVKLAAGRGRMLGPVGVQARYGQPTDAAGYLVLHSDPSSTPVAVLYENPRLAPEFGPSL